MSGTVVRRDFRDLPAVEQSRFCDAVQQMMRNGEFRRLASYHRDYCHHGGETFPGWHRAYLYVFEQALQKADRQNGGNGQIALAYWDWTKTNVRDFVPAMIRQRFPQIYMNSDRQIFNTLHRGTSINRTADASLRQELHRLYSNHQTRGPNLEGFHDTVHGAWVA